jgi:hypothetical protein
MYNATSNNWTRIPNGLGQARGNLAAAALPSGLVIFAGGTSGVPKSAATRWFALLGFDDDDNIHLLAMLRADCAARWLVVLC